MTQAADFTSLTSGYRGELLAYCYRMLGSAEEAEDLVQETYLRAWRSFDGFEGRASVRTWLYRIATNACLTALERGKRRPLPSGIGAPSDDPEGAPLADAHEWPWLQPLPGAMLPDHPADPAAVVASRAGIRLAFVAALQHLTARQRAILILREVLEWPAAQVAEFLDTTTAAVNSGLRRARAHLAEVMPGEDELAEPSGRDQQAMLERFAAALEEADVAALASLLREDVTLEMPPQPTWFAGRSAVLRFFAAHVLTAPGRFRKVPLVANGQPSLAVYHRGTDGQYDAFAISVLTLTPAGIARIVTFTDPGLVRLSGLPARLGAAVPDAVPGVVRGVVPDAVPDAVPGVVPG